MNTDTGTIILVLLVGISALTDLWKGRVYNAVTVPGLLLGLALSYHLDETRFHFDESAPLLGQILKVVLGLILIVGIRAGLKPLFALISDGLYWNAVRYFCMVAFAGIVWPRTFSWFQKIGRKQ